MEHVKKTGAFRKCETNSNLVDELGDAVGTIEAILQFPFRDTW